MKNGKKLSVAQCKLLEEHGIENPRDWLYIKTERTDVGNASYSLSKFRDKITVMVIQNKDTGEIKRIEL